MLILIAVQMLFAISYIFLKKISLVESPILITGIRLIIGGIILLIFSLLYDNKTSILQTIKQQWKLILLAALLNSFLGNAFGQYGSKFVAASMISFINNLMPFATAIICFIFLNEKISKLKWVGLLFGFIGFLPALLIGESVNLELIKQNLSSELILIFSMLSNAIGWITIKKLTHEKNISVILINGITLSLGGLFAIASSFFIENWSLSLINNSQLWFFNSLIALNTYVVCYILYSYALKKYSATFVAFSSFLATIFTAILGWVFINEQISKLFILSIFIMTIGLFIFYLEERKNKEVF